LLNKKETCSQTAAWGIYQCHKYLLSAWILACIEKNTLGLTASKTEKEENGAKESTSNKTTNVAKANTDNGLKKYSDFIGNLYKQMNAMPDGPEKDKMKELITKAKSDGGTDSKPAPKQGGKFKKKQNGQQKRRTPIAIQTAPPVPSAASVPSPQLIAQPMEKPMDAQREAKKRKNQKQRQKAKAKKAKTTATKVATTTPMFQPVVNAAAAAVWDEARALF
jgi:hypothetical protein